MTLRSARFLQEANDQPLQYHGGPGWRQISAGLWLVAGGYCVLLLGSTLGAVSLWLAFTAQAAPGVSSDVANSLLLLAAATLGLTALFSYGLVLAGQWRCLMYAPGRNSAKELMYVCCHCLILGSVLNGIGAFLDGGKTYAALQQGWSGLHQIDAWSAGNLMQLGSIVLGVVGSLVFSQFLRNVAECFNDRRGARAVDFNLWFMGLLIGVSVGAHLCVRRLTLQADTLPWLIVGWMMCFSWHLWLVLRVRRGVVEGMRKLSQERRVVRPPEAVVAGVVLTHTLSGLHRLARNANA